MQDEKVICGGNGKDNTNGVDSDDRCKGVVEIQACKLGVPFNNNPRFVLFKVSCGVAFDTKYPFERNSAFAEGAGRQDPTFCLNLCLDFCT